MLIPMNDLLHVKVSHTLMSHFKLLPTYASFLEEEGEKYSCIMGVEEDYRVNFIHVIFIWESFDIYI